MRLSMRLGVLSFLVSLTPVLALELEPMVCKGWDSPNGHEVELMTVKLKARGTMPAEIGLVMRKYAEVVVDGVTRRARIHDTCRTFRNWPGNGVLPYVGLETEGKLGSPGFKVEGGIRALGMNLEGETLTLDTFSICHDSGGAKVDCGVLRRNGFTHMAGNKGAKFSTVYGVLCRRVEAHGDGCSGR